MPSDIPHSRTPIKPVAEQAAMELEEENWDNEGGRIRSTANFVTHLRGAELPYHVVLTLSRDRALKRSFATMREAEAFIRCNGPCPPAGLSTLYDRPAPGF